jgi:hypothetical protein
LTDRPRTSDVRKSIPLSVKLAAALRMLGFSKGQRVDFDHNPALALREWDEEKQDFIPAQLDPEHIVILSEPEHRIKTSGSGGTSYGSDQHAIAKIRRVGKDEEEFRRRMLAKTERTTDAPARPKSSIPSRGFSGQGRPLQSRNTFSKRESEA